MPDEPDNLVLQELRAILAELREVKTIMSGLVEDQKREPPKRALEQQ